MCIRDSPYWPTDLVVLLYWVDCTPAKKWKDTLDNTILHILYWIKNMLVMARTSVKEWIGKYNNSRVRNSVCNTWKVNWEVKINLSLSNNPLVVYWYTEYVILFIKFTTRSETSSAGSACSMAFSNTVLNAWNKKETHFILIL